VREAEKIKQEIINGKQDPFDMVLNAWCISDEAILSILLALAEGWKHKIANKQQYIIEKITSFLVYSSAPNVIYEILLKHYKNTEIKVIMDAIITEGYDTVCTIVEHFYSQFPSELKELLKKSAVKYKTDVLANLYATTHLPFVLEILTQRAEKTRCGNEDWYRFDIYDYIPDNHPLLFTVVLNNIKRMHDYYNIDVAAHKVIKIFNEKISKENFENRILSQFSKMTKPQKMMLLLYKNLPEKYILPCFKYWAEYSTSFSPNLIQVKIIPEYFMALSPRSFINAINHCLNRQESLPKNIHLPTLNKARAILSVSILQGNQLKNEALKTLNQLEAYWNKRTYGVSAYNIVSKYFNKQLYASLAVEEVVPQLKNFIIWCQKCNNTIYAERAVEIIIEILLWFNTQDFSEAEKQCKEWLKIIYKSGHKIPGLKIPEALVRDSGEIISPDNEAKAST